MTPKRLTISLLPGGYEGANNDDHDSDWLDGEDPDNDQQEHQPTYTPFHRNHLSEDDRALLRKQGSYFYAQKLRNLDRSWKHIERDLLVAFLLFKQRTENWGGTGGFHGFWGGDVHLCTRVYGHQDDRFGGYRRWVFLCSCSWRWRWDLIDGWTQIVAERNGPSARVRRMPFGSWLEVS